VVSQEQRKRQLAREKFLRQQQRRTSARRKAKMRNSVIASVLGVILIGSVALYTTGVLKDDKDDKANASAQTTPSPSASSKAPDPCAKPAKGSVKKLSWKKEPAMTIDKSAKYTMKLATTCGEIDVALKASAAPHTVNSFNFLLGKGYLDHTKCHRLTPQGIYVLQCGDPTGTGTGGPGYTFEDEFNDHKVERGALAMANAGPNTNGSQFFIVTAEACPWLDGKHTVFGRVTSGMDVVDKIAQLPRDTRDKPREPATIERVEL
jgi:peptidyl-prolyl cis-trans isomerase B (cyclophilin B)